jgi:hypothetical protein
MDQKIAAAGRAHMANDARANTDPVDLRQIVKGLDRPLELMPARWMALSNDSKQPLDRSLRRSVGGTIHLRATCGMVIEAPQPQ